MTCVGVLAVRVRLIEVESDKVRDKVKYSNCVRSTMKPRLFSNLGQKSRGFMVERTNVTLPTVRPMLTAVRKGRLTHTAVNKFFSRAAASFGLPFRTAVSVGLLFHTSGTKNSKC